MDMLFGIGHYTVEKLKQEEKPITIIAKNAEKDKHNAIYMVYKNYKRQHSRRMPAFITARIYAIRFY